MASAEELKAKLVSELAYKAVMGSVLHYNIPIASTPVFQNEVLDFMLDLFPKSAFVAVYDYGLPEIWTGRCIRNWKLKTRNRVDLGVLASGVGGSGSRNEASFVQDAPWDHLIVDCKPMLMSQVEYDE